MSKQEEVSWAERKLRVWVRAIRNHVTDGRIRRWLISKEMEEYEDKVEEIDQPECDEGDERQEDDH